MDLLVQLVGVSQSVLLFHCFHQRVVAVFDRVFGADAIEFSGDEGPSAAML